MHIWVKVLHVWPRLTLRGQGVGQGVKYMVTRGASS